MDSPEQLIAALKGRPWLATSLQWLLFVEGAPIYVISPQGPFAREAYDLLREFLEEQIKDGVERVSIPGYVTKPQALRAGYSVPTIVPEIRGMYNWTTSSLVERITKDSPAAVGVTQFLERVYFELRNPGRSSQERALNFAATNAFQLEQVYEKALEAELELDLIEVDPNPLARPGCDCWDVKLTFFSPQKKVARQTFRFTVDVSDVVPARIGPVRSWSIR